MGRPRHPAAGGPGAGDRPRPLHRPIFGSAHWVRFVRSPVASGRIVGIAAPDGARIYRAADLDGVRPIRPMLHKFNYQPIEQPILAAKDVVRFVGEPIAAVVASSRAEAEDIAEAVDDRDRRIAGSRRRAGGAATRRAAGARQLPCQRRGRRPLQDRRFRRDDRAGAPASSASVFARAGRMRRRSKRARRMRRSIRRRAASR